MASGCGGRVFLLVFLVWLQKIPPFFYPPFCQPFLLVLTRPPPKPLGGAWMDRPQCFCEKKGVLCFSSFDLSFSCMWFQKTPFCLKSIFKNVFEQYNARVFKIPVLKRCTLSGSIFGNKSFVFMFKNSKAGLAFKCWSRSLRLFQWHFRWHPLVQAGWMDDRFQM